MNKYLEKISALTNRNKLILGGTAVGAGLGSLVGFKKNRDPRINDDGIFEEERPYSKTERVKNTLAGIAIGGVTGAYLGMSHIESPRSRYKGHYSNPPPKHKDLNSLFKEMNGTGFTTKEQARRHYKTMAAKWHPDRHGGNSEKMQKINTAWTKIKEHPDFEKMAGLNKYIGVLYNEK
jgi:hypothetical protein